MMRLFKTFLCVFLSFLYSVSYGVEIYGHRGAAGLAPENTLQAIQTAIHLGVDTIDLDIGLTEDGHIVVHHDTHLNPHTTRAQDGVWLLQKGPAIKTLKLEALKQLDVGRINPASDYRDVFPLRASVDGTRIPTLEEAIRFAKNLDPNMTFQLEIKTSPFEPESAPSPDEIVPRLLQLLSDENVLEDVEVHSFDWRNLTLIKKLNPKVVVSFITEEALYEEQGVQWLGDHQLTETLDTYPKLIHHLSGQVWCPYYKDLTQEAIKEAHDLGLKVTTWSVDDPQAMIKLVEWGVDGIITNRPDILHGLLIARGLRAPKNKLCYSA